MIVDCHTHIDCIGLDRDTARELLAEDNIDMSIILPSGQRPADESNELIADFAKTHSDRAVGFALVNPLFENYDAGKLSRLGDMGLKGFVLYCSKDAYHPAHSNAMCFYESVQRLGMPVFFHNGSPLRPDSILEFAQPFLLDEVARQFSDMRIIIGSMGFPFPEQTLAMLAKHENVYADLTVSTKTIWNVYNTVVRAHEMEVMDKLLFGSGFPFGDPERSIETLLGFNKLLGDTNLPIVPREKIRAIIERDTLKLLGIR